MLPCKRCDPCSHYLTALSPTNHVACRCLLLRRLTAALPLRPRDGSEAWATAGLANIPNTVSGLALC